MKRPCTFFAFNNTVSKRSANMIDLDADFKRTVNENTLRLLYNGSKVYNASANNGKLESDKIQCRNCFRFVDKNRDVRICCFLCDRFLCDTCWSKCDKCESVVCLLCSQISYKERAEFRVCHRCT